MQFTAFDDRETLANWLAQHVAGELKKAIAARGRAVMAVSGGTTPSRFFKKLSRQELDWEKVWITLADERWVPPDSAQSNQRLVTMELLQANAAPAQFVPLFEPETDLDDLTSVDARLRPLMPLDIIVLGMGQDGHTASLFPGGDHLTDATDMDTKALVIPMRAEFLKEDRITLTLPAITSAAKIALHIEGQAKRDVLEEAGDRGDPSRLPIQFVLQRRPDIRVVWAP